MTIEDSNLLKKFRMHPAGHIAQFSPVLASVYRVIDRRGFLSDIIADPITFLSRPIYHFWPDSFKAKEHGPLVSVIVATRNNSATIERALMSLLRQTYSELEVIVIDDASDDNSMKLIEGLAAFDRRLTVVSGKRQIGTGAARNIGLTLATGKYVTFQDGDDFSEPNRIALQVAALERNRSKSICLCNYVRVNSLGRTMQINKKRVMKCIISMMFKRDIVRSEVGFFVNESVGEDSDLYERIKIALGDDCEIILPRLLYRALYRRGSSFFSTMDIMGDGMLSISYVASNEFIEAHDKIKTRHYEMRAGRLPVRNDLK